MIGDTASTPDVPQALALDALQPPPAETAQEFGGRPGLDPTRFGDWEKNGRCIDF